ncbi:aromatic-ring-hydroxylating dioxygenase subunit beta [Bradyrhizobium sp. RD5-C2]|uniref:2,4-D oxygenase small subunit of oxygenase component n=1 Tax=Bradyrhizobium sp. HW13 TaxID=161773 RepID=Q8VUZ1_9BRAD|nr:aromatic-ring-hydroxylating dioxygenase subunit beta [Bradyrhizobium sp. RD5-C2]BAB78522.1 2,4-D oxygenase small subunit of oxygenase component [Bradyrhizobium sp. HW13]GIQ78272.1 2,4-dichlorophenoxyacetic acid oxygenase small subunit [Bradyrhizobium sp. RD5-C2]
MNATLHVPDGTVGAFARAVASDLILTEAHELDSRNWAAWLALYSVDAKFWMPAWLDENAQSDDPNTQVSLIYHESRLELEERVDRVNSLKSITTMPLPRTIHVIGGIRLLAHSEDRIQASSSANVHVYDPRTSDHHIAAVRYSHTLSRTGDGPWLITCKTISLINDRMPSVVDFYTV